MSILLGILLFGVIVLAHEFGHFIFAKASGIEVVEFSIGMGPRLWSFERKGTRYSIKCLPFGGSCIMAGEDADNPDPGAFNNKPVLSRILVIAAGPVFNLILAFLFAMVIVSQSGHDMPIIHDVLENTPAAEAGLRPGDKLTRINNRKMESRRDVLVYLMSHPGKPVTVHVERPAGGSWENGGAAEKLTMQITPMYDSESQSYMIGVTFLGNYEMPSNPLELIRFSAYEVKYCVTTTFDSIRMLIQGQMAVRDSVAGPVRIVSMVGENIEESQQGGIGMILWTLSYWGLLLSASLGIMNLLPIPALDGGRLLFLLIELLRGRPVDPEKEGMVHAAGMAFLMMIMVMVLFNDIRGLL